MTGTVNGPRRVRDAALGAVLAGGLFIGGAGIAGADPSLVPTPAPKPTIAVEGGAAASAGSTTAGATTAPADILDVLADEYAVGAGGGQVSNLLKVALKLRAMGFRPSKPYLDQLKNAMNYRPNQLPLISALKDTIAYQQKLQAQKEILTRAQAQQNPGSAVMGAGPMPGASNPANVVPGAPGAPGAPVPAPPVMGPMPVSP